jgi:hypothetical protein
MYHKEFRETSVFVIFARKQPAKKNEKFDMNKNNSINFDLELTEETMPPNLTQVRYFNLINPNELALLHFFNTWN